MSESEPNIAWCGVCPVLHQPIYHAFGSIIQPYDKAWSTICVDLCSPIVSE